MLRGRKVSIDLTEYFDITMDKKYLEPIFGYLEDIAALNKTEGIIVRLEEPLISLNGLEKFSRLVVYPRFYNRENISSLSTTPMIINIIGLRVSPVSFDIKDRSSFDGVGFGTICLL